MKAVITVIGRDTVGVVAKVSAVCAELNINIEDITQSIMQDMFCMIMLVDMKSLTPCTPSDGEELGDANSEPQRHYGNHRHADR